MRSAALDTDSVRPLSQFLVCFCPTVESVSGLPLFPPQCSASEETCLFFPAIDRRVAVWEKLYVLRSRMIRTLIPPNPVDTSFCAQVHCTTTLLREQTDEWLILTTFPF
jgi:hypothetical protein